MRLATRSPWSPGAAGGIGLATAQRFAARAQRSTPATSPSRPPDRRRRHPYPPARCQRPRGLGRLAGEIADEAGGADILVNNAGLVGSYDGLTDMEIDRWHAIIAVNQTGVFYGMRSVIPLMCSRGGGSIINVSSIWGLVGAPGVAAYQASKGAVTLMTKNAAMTYAPEAIRVNSVHPGSSRPR